MSISLFACARLLGTCPKGTLMGIPAAILAVFLLAFPGQSAAEQSQDRPASIELAIEALGLALMEKSEQPLMPYLDPGFSYQGQQGELARSIMAQVVRGFPHLIHELEIGTVTPVNPGWQVEVRLLGPEFDEVHDIDLSAQGLIVRAEIARIQMAGHSPAPLARTTHSEAFTLPFEIVERMIVVQASVNGVAGSFIVDSGAQAMVLNAGYFTEQQVATRALDHAMPTGVGGAIENVRGALNLNLKWGGLERSGLRALVADLSHLEQNLGHPVTGLIGFNLLQEFETYFDYERQVLTLNSLDADGQPLAQIDRDHPVTQVSFDMLDHLPLLPVRIGELDLRLGLDSGAGGAMLRSSLQESMSPHYQFLRTDEMRGADHNVQLGDVVQIERMEIGALTYDDVTFRFNDIGGPGQQDRRIDGLLGYEFLRTHPTAINFRTRTLSIWANPDPS